MEYQDEDARILEDIEQNASTSDYYVGLSKYKIYEDVIMKAEEQLKKFKLELADLMEKYNITISASEEYIGYMSQGTNITLECYPPYADEYLGYIEEKLGQYINSEILRNN